MKNNRPFCVSIAGFDPSAGAGLLADVKTFEQNQVYGFGVCSALTVQNDEEFQRVEWLSSRRIIEQLEILANKFHIKACKIGIIGSLQTLEDVINYLRDINPSIQIVLDPVLKASAGYTFHRSFSMDHMEFILKNVDLITPNTMEMAELETLMGSFARIKRCCNILLKGGHSPDNTGTDILFEGDNSFEIKAKTNHIYQKHGSGCVLSAAITAQLATGNTLTMACIQAKAYTERFLNSNESFLGFHKL